MLRNYIKICKKYDRNKFNNFINDIMEGGNVQEYTDLSKDEIKSVNKLKEYFGDDAKNTLNYIYHQYQLIGGEEKEETKTNPSTFSKIKGFFGNVSKEKILGTMKSIATKTGSLVGKTVGDYIAKYPDETGNTIKSIVDPLLNAISNRVEDKNIKNIISTSSKAFFDVLNELLQNYAKSKKEKVTIKETVIEKEPVKEKEQKGGEYNYDKAYDLMQSYLNNDYSDIDEFPDDYSNNSTDNQNSYL